MISEPLSQLQTSRSPRAFTLIELLMVVTIIGILAGLMYPASHAIMKKVRMSRTETTALHLKNAINTYLTEYRKLPVRQSIAGEAEIHLLSDGELMDVLCASPSETGSNGLNPKKIVFFTGGTARPMGEGKYRNGVRITSDGTAKLFDSWGNHFFVILDGDNNGRVPRPEWDERSDSAEILQSILVWSSGPDSDNATGSDNVPTW